MLRQYLSFIVFLKFQHFSLPSEINFIPDAVYIIPFPDLLRVSCTLLKIADHLESKPFIDCSIHRKQITERYMLLFHQCKCLLQYSGHQPFMTAPSVRCHGNNIISADRPAPDAQQVRIQMAHGNHAAAFLRRNYHIALTDLSVIKIHKRLRIIKRLFIECPRPLFVLQTLQHMELQLFTVTFHPCPFRSHSSEFPLHKNQSVHPCSLQHSSEVPYIYVHNRSDCNSASLCAGLQVRHHPHG